MLLICLLNSIIVLSILVSVWLQTIRISPTYLRYPVILCFNNIWYSCLCSMCCMYVSVSIADGGHPLLILQFVCNIVD
jgi:hypothetical protein